MSLKAGFESEVRLSERDLPQSERANELQVAARTICAVTQDDEDAATDAVMRCNDNVDLLFTVCMTLSDLEWLFRIKFCFGAGLFGYDFNKRILYCIVL